MAGECLCVHALRRDVTNRVRVQVSASVARALTATIASDGLFTASASVHAVAVSSLVCASTARVATDLVRPMTPIISWYSSVQSAADKICGIDLTFGALFDTTANAAKNNAVQITFFANPLFPPVTAARTAVLPQTQLALVPGGNIRPAFQYKIKLQEHIKSPPRQTTMDVVRGAKTDIEITAGAAANLAYARNAEAELKTETTIRARADVLNMSAIIRFSPLMGLAPKLPMRDNRPVFAQKDSVGRLLPVRPVTRNKWLAPRPKWRSPNDLFMRQEHRPNHCYKKEDKRPPCCDPLRFKFCCISTVMAPLTSPAGELTQISKKKDKLRIVQALHPDSKKQNEDGSFPPKKYIWRFAVHPANDPPCACEFIHLGLYLLRDSVWKFNESKPVLLLVNSAEFQSKVFNSCFFVELPVPRFYPQFDERGEYRVVMVKNLMYDIYPPSTFVRTEFEGTPPSPVEREVILNEVSHFVFVHEGCGNNFFLINAECD